MKVILWIVAIVIIAGAIIGYSIYNKPHEDMRDAEPDHRLGAHVLFKEYQEDENTANEKYLGKVIRVNGTISNVQKEGGDVKAITLESGGELSGVVAELDQVYGGHRDDFKEGEEVLMQCVCTGFLMDVILNRCVEIENQ